MSSVLYTLLLVLIVLSLVSAVRKDKSSGNPSAVSGIQNRTNATDNSSASDGKVRLVPMPPQWLNTNTDLTNNKRTFRCFVSGSKPMTVTWYKNGKRLTKNQHRYKFERRGQLLSIKRPRLQDSASYRCVAENKFGKIQHTFELAVIAVTTIIEAKKEPPVIHLDVVENKTVFVGDDVTFRCAVHGFVTIHWIKHVVVNGSKTHPNGSDNVQVLNSTNANANDDDKQRFTLSNVSLQDSGKYSCVAHNKVGASHTSKWLIVLPRPGNPEPTALPTPGNPVPAASKSAALATVFVTMGLVCFISLLSLALLLYTFFSDRFQKKRRKASTVEQQPLPPLEK